MVHPKTDKKKRLIKLYTKSIQKHRKSRRKSMRGRFCGGYYIYMWQEPLRIMRRTSRCTVVYILKGLISLLPFTTLFYHPLLGWLCLLPCNILLYPTSFLNQGYCFISKLTLSSCIALSFHATRDMIFYPDSLLWEGIHSPTVHLFKIFSRF